MRRKYRSKYANYTTEELMEVKRQWKRAHYQRKKLGIKTPKKVPTEEELALRKETKRLYWKEYYQEHKHEYAERNRKRMKMRKEADVNR